MRSLRTGGLRYRYAHEARCLVCSIIIGVYDLDLDSSQKNKIFFTPYIDEGNEAVQASWHGRVLPGQTIREGVLAEFKQMQPYDSLEDFSINTIEFQDFAKDRKGNTIPRFKIVITLHRKQDRLKSIRKIDARKMTPQDIAQLSRIIGIDANDYIEQMESGNREDVLFSDFFLDYLVDNGNVAVGIDWKWEPDDIVSQLKHMLVEHTFKLAKNETQDGTSFDIELEIDGHKKTLHLSLDEPDLLLETVNKVLESKQFIAVDFDDDSYNWLLVPNDFSPEFFAELSGYAEDASFVQARSATSNDEYIQMLYYDRIEDGRTTGSVSVRIEWRQGKVRVYTPIEKLRKILINIVSELDLSTSVDALTVELVKRAPKIIDGLILRDSIPGNASST